MRVAGGEEMARGEEVGFDGVVHLTSPRGPGADLVEMRGGVVAFGEVDAGQEGLE